MQNLLLDFSQILPRSLPRSGGSSSEKYIPRLRNIYVLQLPNIGIAQQFITFTNVTMESEKFICVRETGATNSVVIVDMANPLTPLKRPITADSALMNPASQVIALKATVAGATGDSLQIFNLELKSKMKSFQISQPVTFWKWISSSKLGLVTATTVYHWDMNVSMQTLCTRASEIACLIYANDVAEKDKSWIRKS